MVDVVFFVFFFGGGMIFSLSPIDSLVPPVNGPSDLDSIAPLLEACERMCRLEQAVRDARSNFQLYVQTVPCLNFFSFF